MVYMVIHRIAFFTKSGVGLGIYRILRFVLIIEMIALLGATAVISRDYQDSWILEGLEIPFFAFMITYIIYVFIEKEITWIIPFALICRSVFLILPNLKYGWFQGVAIDQHSHYRLVQDIYYEGYIPSGRLYSDTPLMHLSFVIYSIITGVPTLYSFKYLPVMAWFIYPLVIYLIMKKLGIMKNSSLLKYVLLMSSIPIYSSLSYVVIGLLFGELLMFLFLYQLIKLLQKKDRRDWFVAIIYGLALVATHSYSSTMFIIALFTMYLMTPLLRKFLHKHSVQLQLKSLSFTGLLAILLINITWLFHKATNLLQSMIKIMTPYGLRLLGEEVIAREPIPSRFFELIRINFIEGIKVLLVWHGGDILFTLLTLIGIVVIYFAKKPRMQSGSLVFLSLYVISLWLFLIPGFALRIGGGRWVERIIRLTYPVSPIFSGICLFYFNKKIRNTKLTIIVISMIMMLATVELYGCQPLVPPASAISKDLPPDEPIGHRVLVNSVYQRTMIEHAERYVSQNTLIAGDDVTRFQILGLTDYNFYRSHVRWYYPLDKSHPKIHYDYFLIHLPGKSGVFMEKAEMRTRSLISQAIYNSSVVYTNGESYMLAEPFIWPL